MINAPYHYFPLGVREAVTGIPWGLDCKEIATLWNLKTELGTGAVFYNVLKRIYVDSLAFNSSAFLLRV